MTEEATATELERNRQVALEYLDRSVNRRDPAGAAEHCVGPQLIQHEPLEADGKKAYVEFHEKVVVDFPQMRIEPRRTIAEGDMVVVHGVLTFTPEDRGHAIVDLFRFEDGKIVEHWDVFREIPEESANDNGMV